MGNAREFEALTNLYQDRALSLPAQVLRSVTNRYLLAWAYVSRNGERKCYEESVRNLHILLREDEPCRPIWQDTPHVIEACLEENLLVR